MNEYWPFDLVVGLCYVALCLFAGFRAATKTRALMIERSILRDQLRQLQAMRVAAQLPETLYMAHGAGGGQAGSGNSAHLSGVYNASFATQQLSGVARDPSVSDARTRGANGSGNSAADDNDPSRLTLQLPPITSDRRLATVALLLLIAVYASFRAAFLFLGAFGAVPMDGSLKSHMVTTLPAGLFMALQTGLIARWARHVRESESRLYARDFPVAGWAVYVSAAFDVSELMMTLGAAIDIYGSNHSKLTPKQWNLLLTGVAGGVYAMNGLVFLALGLRLFFVWVTSTDQLRYDAAVEAHRIPTTGSMTNTGLGQGTSSRSVGPGALGAATTADATATGTYLLHPERRENKESRSALVAGCTRNGSRGRRILGVAFVFGTMCVLRGGGLLFFVLQEFNSVHEIVHNQAAPAGALLFEFVALVVTLRLLMPPGTSLGDRDPTTFPAAGGAGLASSNAVSQFTISDGDPGVEPSVRIAGYGNAGGHDASRRAAQDVISNDDGLRRATSAHGIGGGVAGNTPQRGRRGANTAGGGRNPRHHRSAWAGAHALETYDDGVGEGANSSWKLGDATSSGHFREGGPPPRDAGAWSDSDDGADYGAR